MEKLQEMIDSLLGDIVQKPGPLTPSEVAIQRDRQFVETARKIEKLKQARLQAQSRQ